MESQHGSPSDSPPPATTDRFLIKSKSLLLLMTYTSSLTDFPSHLFQAHLVSQRVSCIVSSIKVESMALVTIRIFFGDFNLRMAWSLGFHGGELQGAFDKDESKFIDSDYLRKNGIFCARR